MAILNGVDASSYQASLNLNNVPYDFVMVKATEGNTYINPDCDMHFQEAKSANKKRGVYHFASHGDAVTEANYFVDNCLGYVGDGILALDWEGTFVSDVAWALAWLRQVELRTGVKPVIYMSEWVENTYDWSSVVAADYGLWLAKYSDYELNNNALNYDMSNAGDTPSIAHWDFCIMWQWTSKGHLTGYASNLDCDIFYGDGSVWDAYAAPHTTNPAPQPQVIDLPKTPDSLPTAVVDVPVEAVVTPPVVDPPVTVPVNPSPPVVVTPEPPKAVDIIVPQKGNTEGNTMDNTVSKAENVATKVVANQDTIAAVVSDFSQVKAGWKTSEFWVKVAIDVAALTGGLFQSHTWETRSAALLTVLVTTVAYIWSRSTIKKSAISK
jgi:lysozyme